MSGFVRAFILDSTMYDELHEKSAWTKLASRPSRTPRTQEALDLPLVLSLLPQRKQLGVMKHPCKPLDKRILRK
jgi:hypothetical protein